MVFGRSATSIDTLISTEAVQHCPTSGKQRPSLHDDFDQRLLAVADPSASRRVLCRKHTQLSSKDAVSKSLHKLWSYSAKLGLIWRKGKRRNGSDHLPTHSSRSNSPIMHAYFLKHKPTVLDDQFEDYMNTGARTCSTQISPTGQGETVLSESIRDEGDTPRRPLRICDVNPVIGIQVEDARTPGQANNQSGRHGSQQAIPRARYCPPPSWHAACKWMSRSDSLSSCPGTGLDSIPEHSALHLLPAEPAMAEVPAWLLDSSCDGVGALWTFSPCIDAAHNSTGLGQQWERLQSSSSTNSSSTMASVGCRTGSYSGSYPDLLVQAAIQYAASMKVNCGAVLEDVTQVELKACRYGKSVWDTAAAGHDSRVAAAAPGGYPVHALFPAGIDSIHEFPVVDYNVGGHLPFVLQHTSDSH